MRQRNLLTWAFILAGGLPPTGWALTNPNFTPADLVKGCPTITEMQLCGDGKGGWIARDLKSVWAGSTPMLARAIRYALTDPVHARGPCRCSSRSLVSS